MIKRIAIILGSFFLALYFSILENNSVKLVPIVSTAVSDKVIVIDAGHGTPDEGAVGQNNISEANINLQIALKLQQLLESSGSIVILTRSDENSISEIDSNSLSKDKVSDIKKRVEIGNKSSADIFVSIHQNKISESKYWGWQTFYKENDEKSKDLVTSIQKSLNTTISNNNTRVPHKLTNVYIMKNVEIPICLVECGFLSNYEEAIKLTSDEYQNKLAWGIYDGISDYFRNH